MAKSEYPVALYFGSDEFTIDETVSRLFKRWSGDRDVVDGAVDKVAEAADALARVMGTLKQADLFGGQKVVWLKCATFLAAGGAGKSASTKALLKELTQLIEDGLHGPNRLLITAPTIDKRSAFYKWLNKKGHVQECALPEKSWEAEPYARQFATQRFADEELRVGSQVVDTLIMRAGTDPKILAHEIGKLAVYNNGDGELTPHDVILLATPAREAILWDLADAVSEGRVGDALQTQRQLLGQGEGGIRLIMEVARRFRELQIFKECIQAGFCRVPGGRARSLTWDSGGSVEAVLGALGDSDPRKMHPFRALRLAQQTARYRADALSEARRLIMDTHEQMLSSSVPTPLLLEILLLKLEPLGGRVAREVVL